MPRSVVVAPVEGALTRQAMSPMPAIASASARLCSGSSFSPKSHPDMAMVKNTCICTTSEARPGVMSDLIA